MPGRWLRRLVGVLGLGGIVFGVVVTLRGGAPITVGDGPVYHRHLGFGYWAWVLSFACAAVALRLREPGRATDATDAVTP